MKWASRASKIIAVLLAVICQPKNNGQSTDERTVFVAVAEKDGIPIPDLNREDFSVLENGKPQEIVAVSSASSVPMVMCVLVDSSGSERGNARRRKELEGLYHFLATTMTDADGALVVAFNERSLRLTGITNNLSELRAGLEKAAQTQPRGPTAVYDGLDSCSEAVLIDRNPRKMILVLSDFEDNSSRASLEKTVTDLGGSGVAVFAFVESDGDLRDMRARQHARKAGQRITRASGGLEYSVKSSDDFDAALKHLQAFLRASYVVRYRAFGNPDKHNVVPLKIEVQRKGAAVFAPQSRPPATP